MIVPLFSQASDYLAFEELLAESLHRSDAPALLSYCLMPDRWHLVVLAKGKTNLSTWMQWVCVTHAHRWHARVQTDGEGSIYHGRFKSFPVQGDIHFLSLCQFVESGAKREKIAKRAELWQWSSLWSRRNSGSELKSRLGRWPIPRPRTWLRDVNAEMDSQMVVLIDHSIERGTPLGDDAWKARIAGRLSLELTTRPRGRPRKNR